MKKLLATALFCASTMLSFADGDAVTAKVQPLSYFSSAQYEFQHGVKLQNQANHYNFTIVRKKANGAKPARNSFMLGNSNTTKAGFCTAENFLSVTVNGIEKANIMITQEMLTELADNGNNGATLKLNFDGCQILLKVFMKPNSPLLYFTVERATDSPEELKSCELRLVALVSGLKKKDKKVQFANVYNREALTATRQLPQGQKKIPLTAEDRFLILRDGEMDGSAKEKGEGPCAIVLPAFDSVASTHLFLRNSYLAELFINLKPDFKPTTFAVLQYPVRLSNEEMQKRLESIPEFAK